MLLLTLVLILASYTLPGIALSVPDMSMASNSRKLAITLMSATLNCWILSSVSIQQTMIAYFVGIYAAWCTMRSIIWFSIQDPRTDYIALRVVTDQIRHSIVSKRQLHFTIRWEKYPPKFSLRRVLWIMDLSLSSRAFAWCYHAVDGRPCSYHDRWSRNKKTITLFQKHSFHPQITIINAACRILLSLFIILHHQLVGLSYITSLSSKVELNLTDWCWMNLATAFLTTMTSMALIDLLHSVPRLLSSILFCLGWYNPCLIWMSQPSPWGQLCCIFKDGLRGK